MAERLKKPVEIFSLDKGDGRDYLLPFKIAKIVKRIKPDIVHTRNWAAIDGVIGARLAGVKSVIHGEHGREASDLTGANAIRKKIRKALSPWISRFVTVSEELKRWLVHDVGIPEEKVIQIINGVDTKRFKPQESKRMFKKKFRFDEDSFIIGVVGRLDLVKDHDTILNAFRLFCSRNKNIKVKVIVIGTGPHEEKLRMRAKEMNISDNVMFLGDKDDVPQYYNCMDIYILSSIAEGISNTILEAMACGLPVIATHIGGTPELIDDNETGFLFSPGDYAGLSQKISVYFNNPEVVERHGINGRRKAEEHFSLSRMVRRYEEIY
jgi:sugar transferase (PEP-CTERM/EpsH1 system associated)